jgi:hypothetical protein
VDVEHQPTDLAVGGSNPSRRANTQLRGPIAREAVELRFSRVTPFVLDASPPGGLRADLLTALMDATR